jgi:glycosyltransferase involved in cell wall biosynthesis
MAEDDSLEINLLVPDRWREIGKNIFPAEPPGRKIKFHIGKAVFHGYSHRYIFLTKLRGLIGSLKPDVIHAFCEPFSLLALEVLILKIIFSPGSRVIMRSSQNIAFKKYPYRFSFIYHLIESFAFKNTDCIHIPNRDTSGVLRKKGYRGKIFLIPYGRDGNVFKRTRAEDLKNSLNLNGRVVGFAGRLAEEKGLEFLIEAVSDIENGFKLLIVGDGPLKKRLLDLCSDKGLGARVIFSGAVDHEKMPLYLSAMDIYVQPSVKTEVNEEKFGCAVIEAMACGCAVIVTDVGALPGVVGDSGIVVKERSSGDLKNVLNSLFKDKDRLSAMAGKSRQRFMKEYSQERTISGYLKMYGEALN